MLAVPVLSEEESDSSKVSPEPSISQAETTEISIESKSPSVSEEKSDTPKVSPSASILQNDPKETFAEVKKVSILPKMGDFETRIFGMGSYEFGQIVRGQYTHSAATNGILDHYWVQQALIQFGISAERDDGLSMILAGEGALYFPYTLPGDGAGFGYELLGPRFRYYPHHVEGRYIKGEKDEPELYVGLGFFPFKYNKDGRNFGDYLFRANPYPQYLPTHFDSPYQRLLGLHVSSNIVSNLKLDAMMTSEVYLWPLRDFSLSFLAAYTVAQVAELGAGIIGYRMFSVDNRLTTPPPDVQVPPGTKFSFAGTKIMARGALDFKQFLPFKDMLNANEFRLYSEACINGLKNYKVDSIVGGMENPVYPGYNDVMKRFLILIGFNVPTFNVLDVFSIEWEWWNNDFANSYWGAYPTGSGNKQNPRPWKYGPPTRNDPYGGPWHWSVYMRKTIKNNIKFALQFSRDHTILETTLTGTSNGDPEEAVDGLGNWLWMSKIEFGF